MITDNTKALIWLNSFDFLTPAKRTRMLALVDNPSELYLKTEEFERQITEISDTLTYGMMTSAKDQAYMDLLLTEIERYKITPVGLTDPDYPVMLKEIDTPPVLLYCRGNTEIFNSRYMAVVGTRNPSTYGRDVTKKFVNELIDCGFHIVSGLARGTDSIAHETAADRHSPQIAVMGCGLDKVYPPENRGLARRIIDDGGLVITEYRVGEMPLNFHFPIRNRIISGLSEGVLITEAGENSGTMITMNQAIEQGRNVFIVPGSIFNPMSRGTNKRLKDGTPLTGIEDILSEYGIEKVPEEAPVPEQMGITESVILKALEKGELHIEELVKATGLEINSLNSILLRMELDGLIRKLHGNNYGAY
jgi:DNA processing protein